MTSFTLHMHVVNLYFLPLQGHIGRIHFFDSRLEPPPGPNSSYCRIFEFTMFFLSLLGAKNFPKKQKNPEPDLRCAALVGGFGARCCWYGHLGRNKGNGESPRFNSPVTLQGLPSRELTYPFFFFWVDDFPFPQVDILVLWRVNLFKLLISPCNN